QNDVTLKMPAFEWVHVQLHQQKGMISLSPPTICNSAGKGMKKPNQDDEPFFITEEIAAEMIAGGYEFELPPIPCTIRLRDVLERMTDAELALQPGEIADQERERCRRKPCSTS
ncbi:hypothetical protein ACWJUV_26080, partial [Escherichia coli]